MDAAAALVDGISRALGVPHPFAHEANAALTLVEDWRALARQVAERPIAVKPVGYYRSPESVDIYVFECSMGVPGDLKTWKIYRRYRQFQKYVSRSSELLADMVVPRLSQAYLKIFYAKQCKDRLVELHAWLAGVVENTQSYFHTLRDQHPDGVDALFASLWQSHVGPGDANFAKEAMPAVWLCAFLFAGANSPFPHYFRGLPAFAFALEEVNIELTQAPIFPSKLRSSIETSAGLGLRLTPSRDLQGTYIGATVSGFLRGASELDPNLAKVQIGSKLVLINGVDVTGDPFDKVLSHLRSVGLPLRLRFLYNPHLHRRERTKSAYLKELDDRGSMDAGSPTSQRARRASSAVSTTASSQSIGGAQELQFRTRSSVALKSTSSSLLANEPTSGSGGTSVRSKDSLPRRYSVDSRKSIGIFSSVFGDLFGRRRNETADALFANQEEEELASWDDIGGEVRDVVSRGFFTLLSQRLLHDLRQREQLEYDESELLTKSDNDEGSAADTSAMDKKFKALGERKAQGIWSTSTGPLGFSLGACKIRDVEAAMLEIPPQFFSARPSYLGGEKHLGKGFVLVSINNESTFGVKFPAVMRMLSKASRPTSICFRWFKDYSPFLETDLAEQQPAPDSSSPGATHSRRGEMVKANPAKAFEHALECLSEAQSDLCSNLHLALVENASIRNEIGALQDSQRESRQKQEEAETSEALMRAQTAEKDALITRLRLDLATREADLMSARERCQVSDMLLASSKQEYHTMLEAAHASAKQKVAEHEERLVRESNKSIETARVIAERRSKKELETTMNELQRKHEEYLQKLAEEHSEEVESLMQQVVVWRHQVEVLTEAEKRNYAAMINNGVNPYHDYQRSRFGFTDSPFSNERGSSSVSSRATGRAAGGGGGGSSTTAAKRSDKAVGNPNATQQHLEYESWRDGTPEDPSMHTFSELSDRSSLSTGNNVKSSTTFWDRMVSLIAD